MMDFPSLENWQNTRDALHDTALLLNVLQVGIVPPMPYRLHYSLTYTDTGLSTYPLPFGTLQLDLRWVPGLLHIKFDDADDVSYSLDGYSQVELMQAVLGTLAEHGIEPAYNADHINNDHKFDVQTSIISDFGHVLNNIYTIMGRTRAHLMGYMTPAALFPHHFDLSMLWFKDHTQIDEHKHAHLNIGFSVGDATIPRPYFYIYGWRPDGYVVDAFALPSGAQWENAAFEGARIDYDVIRQMPQPHITLENMLVKIAQGVFDAM